MLRKLFLPILLIVMTTDAHAQDDEIWFSTLDDARKDAKTSGKMIIVEFGTSWSMPNVRMAADVWDNEKINDQLKQFNPVYVDTESDLITTYKYRVNTVPTILFLESDGTALLRIKRELKAPEMSQLLSLAANDFSLIRELNQLYKKEKTKLSNCLIAEAMQELAIKSTGTNRNQFIQISQKYLSEINPSDLLTDEKLAQRVKLVKSFNRWLRAPYGENSIRRFLKWSESGKYDTDHQALSLYYAIISMDILKKRNALRTHLENLNAHPAGDRFMSKLKDFGIE